MKALRAGDTAISVHLTITASQGICIIEANERTPLAENGGSINLTRRWANSFTKR